MGKVNPTISRFLVQGNSLSLKLSDFSELGNLISDNIDEKFARF
jgi:hypothetical protein